MSSHWSKIKRFWTAEEIPRWMGISMVALILLSLCATNFVTVRETRRRMVARVEKQQDVSLELLVTALASTDASDASGLQRILRAYAYSHRCEQLRVVDADDTVVASIDPPEIGKPRPAVVDLGSGRPAARDIKSLPTPDGAGQRRAFRMPVAVSCIISRPGDDREQGRYVEGVLASELPVVSGVLTVGTGVTTVLVAGLFLVLYRLMRRHFRAVTCISENLMARGDQIESELDQLRLSDASSTVAEQWNRLVDVLHKLSVAEKRSSASTELKQALQNSRRGELADVVDLIPHGLLYVCNGNVLAYANPAAQRLMDISSESGDRPLLRDLSCGETGQSILEVVNGALNREGSYSAVSVSMEADAGATTYRVRVLPFSRRQRRGECVVMISDISQQVRAERSASEFVSQVTHELRTPLTNIRAYAETLSSGVFDDPSVITECYNVITKETRRLGRLIEDVLSMSQMEVGTIRLHIDDVEVRTLLTDAVQDVRGLAENKKIDMQVSLASKLPVIQGDRDKLAVVINNLLGNALKYTPEGGSIVVGCQSTDDELLISVKDDGIGIDADDHERIFQKFQRGSSSDVGDIEGTGIGLSTALEITRRHGGSIELMSEKGNGATFIVHLPVSGSHAASTPVEAQNGG